MAPVRAFDDILLAHIALVSVAMSFGHMLGEGQRVFTAALLVVHVDQHCVAGLDIPQTPKTPGLDFSALTAIVLGGFDFVRIDEHTYVLDVLLVGIRAVDGNVTFPFVDAGAELIRIVSRASHLLVSLLRTFDAARVLLVAPEQTVRARQVTRLTDHNVVGLTGACRKRVLRNTVQHETIVTLELTDLPGRYQTLRFALCIIALVLQLVRLTLENTVNEDRCWVRVEGTL